MEIHARGSGSDSILLSQIPIDPKIQEWIKKCRQADIYKMSDEELTSFYLAQDSYLSTLPKKETKEYLYFCTFTYDSKKDKRQWFEALKKVLKSSTWKSPQLSYEHADTNLHVHMRAGADNKVSLGKFVAWKKLGHRTDIKDVTNKDNGIITYMQKENEVYDDLNLFFEKLESVL